MHQACAQPWGGSNGPDQCVCLWGCVKSWHPKLAPGRHLETSKTVISWFLHTGYLSVNETFTQVCCREETNSDSMLELFL